MQRLKFSASEEPTLGVELELALVDAETMALKSASEEILARIPSELETKIKPELMQCYIEINSDICRTVREAEQDLQTKIVMVERIADDLGLRLYWSASHPFSLCRDQKVTKNARYKGLVNLLQETARQLVTFGLHVHVGVDGGGKAVMICDRLLRHLPTLLAASCNSPFWEKRITGMHSWRSKVMESLPTAGLPPLMRNWSEYVWLVNHLVETGYIETIREIWWDVRPHHNFGTVEVRICDIPGSLEGALALTALIHCLVTALSDEIDRGTYQHDCHPMMIRQNKWRAARYGLDAQLVDSHTYNLQPARQLIREMVDKLAPTAETLGCADYLKRMLELADEPTWAARQLEVWKKTGDPVEVVREMTGRSRMGAPVKKPVSSPAPKLQRR